MLILATTTDKFQLVSSSTSALDVHASFMDYDGSTVTPGRQNTAITTAATTDIVAAPGASTQRNVKTLHVRNKGSNSNDVTIVFDQNGTDFELHKVTLDAGEALEYVEGVGFFTLDSVPTDELWRILDADATGTNGTAAQPIFPTLGAVTVEAATYDIEGLVGITRTAGTTGHVTQTAFAGTATVSSIQYAAMVKTGDSDANGAVNQTTIRVTTATTVKASSSLATEAVTIRFDGVVRFSSAGTFIPQFKYDVAPGGAPSIKANSYFRLVKRGGSAFTNQGTWT